MKQLYLLAFTLLLMLRVSGQINMSDSTMRVYGYWNLNDKQTYQVMQSKYKIDTSDSTAWDTTSTDIVKYKVDITITDSTANSYTIDWFYHDYEFTPTGDFYDRLKTITNEQTITIKTNELGTFLEVVNWKDVRDNIKNVVKKLSKEMKDVPQIDNVMKQVEGMFSSKESIEAAAIDEIQLFYTYHGGWYKLDSLLEIQTKVPNLYGGEPFDAEISALLDSIDTTNWVSTFRMRLSVDPEQLINATFAYLSDMAATMKIPGPTMKEMPKLKHETWTYTDVHDSGWIIYTIQSKEVSAEGLLRVEELSLELL